MFVNCLKLHNFRNYDKPFIEFNKNLNIIYGENAQGKTNILEAIFLCASGRSHRVSKDQELIKFGEDGYYVKLLYEKNNNQSQIEIFYDKVEKKKLKVNGISLKKIGQLMGLFNAVVFSPEDLFIIKQGPSERRRFVDITISQLKPMYFYDLQQYNKILSQRNSLLKEIKYNKYLIDTLDVWDLKLLDVGSKIINIRMEFLKKLNQYAKEIHDNLTRGMENFEIIYSPSFKIENNSINVIKENFTKKMKSVKEKELEKGITLAGPHRDDYETFINRSNIRLFGSQGQQRSAILSIKLAEIKIVKEETGELPVLLLDDVMSELDQKRQEYLIGSIDGVQTFITCTEKSIFSSIKNADYYLVKSGTIERE